MKTLFILNDPPYGTERSYNGLRLANALAKREEEVRVFLMGDAVACALSGQKTPNGYYNLERMLKGCARYGIEVACCGSCLDARGIGDDRLVEAARRSSLEELADWTLWADEVVVF
ncbi:MAG: DsrE family protein [Gaiellaceae bacterium]